MSGWQIGVEREIAPGEYACLIAERSDWLLWRFETRKGCLFTAAKAAEGQQRLGPLGVGQALHGGSPAIVVHLSDGIRASFKGTYLYSTTEARCVGQRFMQPIPTGFDPMPLDGLQIEVVITSMPGPQAFSKLVKDHGFIDMTGLAAIISAKDEGGTGQQLERPA